ncbi:MAG: hypothetical protein GWO04_22640, partial [Actinobacteria bacterium]|nr:hypothetical protein [Actinomycetota bacterium]
VRTVELAEVVAFGRGSAPARPIGAAAVVLTRTQAGAPAITFHRDGSANEEGGFYLTSRRSEGTAMFATDAYAVEI